MIARRPGVTLAELMVVLALLGIVASVAGLALQSSSHLPANEAASTVATARTHALRAGRRVTVGVRIDGRLRMATALPDGSVIANASLGVDRLSGRRSDGAAVTGQR
jgi:prepilin-type N-terminal cleavage/methylation domain-containing protein